MKTAKITALQPSGMDVKKEFFVNEITLDNGSTGVSWSKTVKPPYQIGDIVTYDEVPIQTGGLFFKGVKKAEVPNTPTKDKAIIYQNAFSQANSFLASVGYSGIEKEDKLQELADVADYIAEHVIKKSGI